MLDLKNQKKKGRKKKGEKQRKPISDLPSGIGVYRNRNGAGETYWRVRLGRRWTGGEVVLRDFPDLDGVRGFVDKQKNQRGGTGKETYTLSIDQMAEARNAFDRLSGTGLSLSHAVTAALARHRKPEDTLTWETAPKQWLHRPIRPLGEATLVAYQNTLRLFGAAMGKKLPHQIEKKQIEEYLIDEEKEWEPATIGHHLRNLSIFYNWMVRGKYCVENPCKDITEPEVLGEIHILDPKAAKSLLEAAAESMRVCVSLAIFGGLRTSEIRRLEWKEIGVNRVEIKAKKTKTRQARMVPILPPLRAVLDGYNGPRAGLVAPPEWREEFERITCACGYRDASGESTWPTNAMRHSFGSYRMDEIQDENQVAAEMGNSPAMIYKHYRKVIQDGETPEFWAIRLE